MCAYMREACKAPELFTHVLGALMSTFDIIRLLAFLLCLHAQESEQSMLQVYAITYIFKKIYCHSVCHCMTYMRRNKQRRSKNVMAHSIQKHKTKHAD